MNLPPDTVYAGEIHRPQAAQEAAVSVREGVADVVVAVEVSAEEEAVRAAPVTAREEVALDEEVGHHVIVVDTGATHLRAGMTLTQHFRQERRDVVALARAELPREIRRPTKPVIAMRRGRLVREDPRNSLPEVAADATLQPFMRQLQEPVRRTRLDDGGIGRLLARVVLFDDERGPAILAALHAADREPHGVAHHDLPARAA